MSKFIFSDKLKCADVTLVFKKDYSTKAKNYRPGSVLPRVSKIFERLMHKQISLYTDQSLSLYMCGYRKGFSTRNGLLPLIENWKKVLDNKGYGGTILMELSKAFETINHDLLVAKLHVHSH